jgi:hypothetical protein
MRRAPEALEREKKIEALIAQANSAEGPSPSEHQLLELIEDPTFRSPAVQPPRKHRVAGKTSIEPRPEEVSGYDEVLGKIRALHRRRNASLFRNFLRELFLAIARAVVTGLLQTDDIELPDPISFRRLSFNPDGIGRIVDSPDRARFDELYRLLDGLDLSRVRECRSCKRLFWARRHDQVGCTKACANRIRSSRFYYKTKTTNGAN